MSTQHYLVLNDLSGQFRFDIAEQAFVKGAEGSVFQVICPNFSSIRDHQVMRIISSVGAIRNIGGISGGLGGGVDLAQ